MRLTSVLVAFLVLAAGSAAALSLPRAADAAPVFDAGPLQASFAACGPDARCLAAQTREVESSIASLPQGRAGVAASVALALESAGYPAPALAATASPSLEAAILRLYAEIAHPVDAALAAEVARQAGAVEPALAAGLAQLVDATADAQVASRGILSAQDRALLADDPRTTMLLATFAGSDPNAPREWREMWAERAAVLARVDRQALADAATALAGAVANARLAASTACEPTLSLPFVVVGGACDDVYAGANAVSVDMGGNDRYLQGAGSGIAGALAGVALDLGAGDDVYTASSYSLGAALSGVGILYDEGGSDSYSLVNFGMGSGTAGLGLLYDAGDGDDAYDAIRRGDTISTIAASLGGVGIVVDEGGADRYHQDGLDGFVYGAAGGAGWLLDLGEGGDSYVTNDLYIELLGSPIGDIVGPVQISAEVFATAIHYDEAGDSSYLCGGHVRQGCQGAGGVGGLALLLDAAGNDRYVLGEAVGAELVPGIVSFPIGQGAGYGIAAPPGVGVGVLADRAGDDTYLAPKWAQGYGAGGVGALLDEGGADTYSVATALVGARGDGQTWMDGGPALGVGYDA